MGFGFTGLGLSLYEILNIATTSVASTSLNNYLVVIRIRVEDVSSGRARLKETCKRALRDEGSKRRKTLKRTDCFWR